MRLNAIVRAMVGAGCSPEQILAVVEAAEQANDSAIAVRRASDAARQRRSRERKNSHVPSRDDSVTHSDTPPHPLKNNSSSYEEEENQNNAPTRERVREPRAKRLPDDWAPSEADTAAAVDLGFSPADIDGEVAKMRDWSRSAKDGARKDWSAFFRNWMRRRLETTGPPARSAQVTSLFPGDRNDRFGNSHQRPRVGARDPTGHGAYAALLDPRPADDPGFRG